MVNGSFIHGPYGGHNLTGSVTDARAANLDAVRAERDAYADRPTQTIIVHAAPGVTYQDVVTAVDIAKGAGVVVIGLASDRAAGGIRAQ